MLTDMQAGYAWNSVQANSRKQETSDETTAIPQERKWRLLERGAAFEDIAISRWTDAQTSMDAHTHLTEDFSGNYNERRLQELDLNVSEHVVRIRPGTAKSSRLDRCNVIVLP